MRNVEDRTTHRLPMRQHGFRLASRLLVKLSRFLRVATRIALYVTKFTAFHYRKERPLLLPATASTCSYNAVRPAMSNTLTNFNSPLDGIRFWAFSLDLHWCFHFNRTSGQWFFLFSWTHGQTHPWVVPLGTISKLNFFGLLAGLFNQLSDSSPHFLSFTQSSLHRWRI
jgi:hypothetical protein